jgi:hypothetical protein
MRPIPSTAFTKEMSDAFARAAAEAGETRDHCFRIAGRTVRLRFAGPALEPYVTPALEHLAVPAVDDSELTIGLWDTASTGVEPPDSRWKDGDYIARGEIRHELGDHVQMSLTVASGTFHYMDTRENVALFWVRHPERVVAWELAAPLRPLLGWWAESTGGQLAHGAAVATDDGGILLAAPGGSGKSSLALACLLAGMGYLGDDYVLLSCGDPLRVHSLYCTAKVDPGHMRETLPGLCRHAAKGVDHEKAMLFLSESHPDRLVAGADLRAIVVPRIAPSGRTALRRATAIEVLVALAPSSIFQLPGAGPRAMRTLGDMVRRVPGYVLDVGLDPDENVGVVRDLLGSEAPDAI